MKIVNEFSYRFASAVLADPAFTGVVSELRSLLGAVRVPLLSTSPLARKKRMQSRARKATRKDSRARFVLFPVGQATLNSRIDGAFSRSKAMPAWEYHPFVVPADRGSGKSPRLAADYRRLRVQPEIQFGNAARWYADVFKFQLSYSLDMIDAAILVVPTRRFANFIDDNISNYERVVRELPSAKLSLTLPILVIGVEPDDWDDVQAAYDDAAIKKEAAGGKKGPIVRIPFEQRAREITDLAAV